MRVNLKGQKKVFWAICLSLGFIVYGATANEAHWDGGKATVAKVASQTPPARGIASE